MILALFDVVWYKLEIEMTNANYGVITRASCEPSYKETALELLGGFAKDLRERAGAELVRYGYFGTGQGAGDLLFVQLYENLGGFDKAQEVYASSASYKSFFQSGKVSLKLRNIVKILPIAFETPPNPSPKYLVFTKGAADPENKNAAVDHIQQATGILSENGALTARFGQIITGSNVGQLLLAVTYPSLDAIEKTYDALNESQIFKDLHKVVDVNQREIIRLIG